MYLMKQGNDATKERLGKTEDRLERLQDTTYKKEDFREFKEDKGLFDSEIISI